MARPSHCPGGSCIIRLSFSSSGQLRARKQRLSGESMGYRTAVPSWCRLSQLLGKTASGRGGLAPSWTTSTSTPARSSPDASWSNSRSACACSSGVTTSDDWKALVAAVSGLAPKAAGRTIRTVAAHWANGRYLPSPGVVVAAVMSATADQPAATCASATIRSREETTTPPGRSTVTANNAAWRTGRRAWIGTTTSVAPAGMSKTPPSTG